MCAVAEGWKTCRSGLGREQGLSKLPGRFAAKAAPTVVDVLLGKVIPKAQQVQVHAVIRIFDADI